jgi:hypothetical protein
LRPPASALWRKPVNTSLSSVMHTSFPFGSRLQYGADGHWFCSTSLGSSNSSRRAARRSAARSPAVNPGSLAVVAAVAAVAVAAGSVAVATGSATELAVVVAAPPAGTATTGSATELAVVVVAPGSTVVDPGASTGTPGAWRVTARASAIVIQQAPRQPRGEYPSAGPSAAIAARKRS